MDSTAIAVFVFRTGDASCENYEVPLILTSQLGPHQWPETCRKIQSSVYRTIDDLTDDGEDFEYEEVAIEAVARLGISWQVARFPICDVDSVITVYA